MLFDYPLDNAEEFSTEISTIEDKSVLLDLKKALIEVRDCCNIVRTFGDDDLKAAFANFEISLPEGYPLRSAKTHQYHQSAGSLC